MARRFGAYEILYELSSGGMGAVLLGRRRGPGTFEQLVAIKTILPIHAQTELVRAMFLDEAALLARLSHPAIATVHDFGEDGGTLYMVMEYVAGIPFREVVGDGMPPAIAARAIAEACRGVHAAHELRDLAGHVLGVVHRDISPDNLMLGFDGHVKVIDFGIALVKNRQAPVTELGTVKGKPPYMSPEQLKNEAIDRRSDVFSLAVVLWEMLTGRGLFEGDSIYAIARAVEHQEILPPSHVLGAPLPLGLDAVVMSALERDRSRRTPSAAAFAEQLEQVIQTAAGETIEAWAARVLDEPRRAHRAWLARVTTGGAGTAGATGGDAPPPRGRPTGSVTAVAPAALGKAATMIAPVAAAPVADAGSARADGAVAGDDRAEAPHAPVDARGSDLGAPGAPPRRRWRPVLLAASMLALVGGTYAVRRALDAPNPRVASVDAPRDAASGADAPGDARAPVVPEPPPRDAGAALPEDAQIDAATSMPLDAGRRRPTRPPPDAGHTATRDATPAAAPQGFGTLIAKHKGDRYRNVVVDGRILGPTPMFGQKLAAGTHVVELVDATSSEVVVKRTVHVEAGGSVSVVEP